MSSILYVFWLILMGFSSDVGFPVEVDDEYWPHVQTDPSFVPAQPAGVPPRAAFFNCYLKLIQILGFALRTIVSI